MGQAARPRHCSLCDITHSPWRRKPAWDAMAAGLSVPIRLVHRNELEEDLAAVVARLGPRSCWAGRATTGSRSRQTTS